MRLAELLELGLRVGGERRIGGQLELRLERAADETAGAGEPAIEEDGADDRFVDVGQVRRASAAAAGLLAAPQQQPIAQLQPPARLRQGVAAHQMRAQLGQLALVLVRVGVVKLVSDDQAENGIAEELHALVRLSSVVRIFVEVGAVDERLL